MTRPRGARWAGVRRCVALIPILSAGFGELVPKRRKKFEVAGKKFRPQLEFADGTELGTGESYGAISGPAIDRSRSLASRADRRSSCGEQHFAPQPPMGRIRFADPTPRAP